jgi:hypothetical protein
MDFSSGRPNGGRFPLCTCLMQECRSSGGYSRLPWRPRNGRRSSEMNLVGGLPAQTQDKSIRAG